MVDHHRVTELIMHSGQSRSMLTCALLLGSCPTRYDSRDPSLLPLFRSFCVSNTGSTTSVHSPHAIAYQDRSPLAVTQLLIQDVQHCFGSQIE